MREVDGQPRDPKPNLRLNPTVSSVTGLACARPAPALPAGQPRCYTYKTPRSRRITEPGVFRK